MRMRVGEAIENLKCKKRGGIDTMEMSKRVCRLRLVLKLGL